jgi:hypothetical protein
MPIIVRDACEACFDAHKDDCSGFVRAVAASLGVTLQGLADDIVVTIRTDPGWRQLPDGNAAAQSAEAGRLVIAGLKGSEQAHPDPHGHVAVVVDGPVERDACPTAYWGSLGGKPGKALTINFAWTVDDRDHVTYAEHDVAAPGTE